MNKTRKPHYADLTNLDELLEMLDVAWYEAVDGRYHEVPSWGPETPEVRTRINRSSPEGDIVSWDTTSEPHRYLMRRWTPADRVEHRFYIDRRYQQSPDLS